MNLIAFKQYFEAIATSHVGIVAFKYGGLEHLLNLSDGPTETYPLLFLEKPNYGFEGSATNILAKPRAAFVIVTCSDPQDRKTTDQLEEAMFAIATDIIAKMLDDVREGILEWFEPAGASLDPIDHITLDAALGWRFEFQISDTIDLCVNPLKWN